MKFLIIGCGSIGCRHARVAMETGKYAVALCDQDTGRLNAIANELGITETYTDMDEAIRLTDAEAVIVCTPNHLHKGPTIAALRGGKDVLCEKPIATSLEDAKAMVDAANETGRKLMIGYTLRCTKRIQKIKELVDSGKLGKIVSARVTLTAPETLIFAKSPFRAKYETGGGIVYDYTHQIDYCRYFFGDAKKCFGYVSSRLPYLAACDDSAEGIVDYGDMTVNYHWDYVQWHGFNQGNHVCIVGENAAIDLIDKTHVLLSYNDGSTEMYELASDAERNNSFRDQLDVFTDFCKTGTSPISCTGQDAYEDLRLADALYQSSREGRMIEL